MTKNRQYYVKNYKIYINNKHIPNVRVKSIESCFKLSYCFCSCSVYCDDKLRTAHHENCPNAIGKIVGYIINGKPVFLQEK